LKIAGIDIGTNSIRYLAVETHPYGPPEIIARGLATPRLGEELAGTGRISDKAFNRTINELSRINNELKSMGVSEFKCVGTEALRLADNGDIFIRRAAEIGLTINILTGEEEAGLIYAGATDNLNLSASGYILSDVGGGSTEIITAPRGEEPRFISLPLGCVRLKELAGDQGLDWMREYCHDLLEKYFPAAPAKESISSDGKTLIGLGGTFTTLAAIHLQLTDYDGDRIHGLPIPKEEIGRIGEELFRCDADEMKKILGMEPSRADIIISGIIIVQSIMNHLGFNRVTISDRGILWGLIPKYSEGNPSANPILS